jgi:exodeoxyribonuclease VII small subunit
MKNFEENLRLLDEIINSIEEGAVPLEASLALYKKGMALAADCAAALTEFEKEVMILGENKFLGENDG